MSDYTPSVAEMREYVETGGEPRPWVELDSEEKAREQFRAEAFDRMIEAVRAEERERALVKHYDYIEGLGKTAMSLGFTGFGLGYARAIEQVFEWAARIREQGRG